MGGSICITLYSTRRYLRCGCQERVKLAAVRQISCADLGRLPRADKRRTAGRKRGLRVIWGVPEHTGLLLGDRRLKRSSVSVVTGHVMGWGGAGRGMERRGKARTFATVLRSIISPLVGILELVSFRK